MTIKQTTYLLGRKKSKIQSVILLVKIYALCGGIHHRQKKYILLEGLKNFAAFYRSYWGFFLVDLPTDSGVWGFFCRIANIQHLCPSVHCDPEILNPKHIIIFLLLRVDKEELLERKAAQILLGLNMQWSKTFTRRNLDQKKSEPVLKSACHAG